MWCDRLTQNIESVTSKDFARNKREYFLCEVQEGSAPHTKNILFYLSLDPKELYLADLGRNIQQLFLDYL
jgi:hypothetical protein